MKFKKSQSGRSMVEMLGVLAIIGVLSVGGIAGYSLSMRRHRANQVVDLTSKYALNAYTHCQLLVNQQSDPYVKNTSDCSFMTYSYSSDIDVGAEIGPVPAGVEQIAFQNVTSTDEGSDTVNMYVNFSDMKLCQTVSSIVGRECASYGQVIVGIKQN